MQRIAIIGLGLIGGSIGLGLRQWNRSESRDSDAKLEIVGFDSDLEQQEYARKIHAVDKTEWSLANAVRDADIVILATPVTAIREVMTDIADSLKAGAIVADVGSTKADVMQWASEILPQTVHFVGTHPMAGKSQSIEAAEPDLFSGAVWVVTPSPRASQPAVQNILGMVAALNAEPFFIDPAEHDAYVAGISHLPAVISAALVNAVSSDPSWRDMKTLSATGFRDVSRLAAGSPEMHRDILVTNQPAVTRWIDAMIDQLQTARTALNSAEPETELLNWFTAARDARADWATQTTREGGLLQSTESELSPGSIGDQVGRMLLGGFANKRRANLEKMLRGRTSRTPPHERSRDN